MTLITNGYISRYFAETLVLLFFPGSKFPKEGDTSGECVELTVTESDIVTGYASIRTPAGEWTAEYTVPAETAARLSREMQCKTAAGGAMLLAGQQYSGATPPWGMLTGVRPVSMVLDMLEKGMTPDEAVRRLTAEFFCQESKARLAVRTACDTRPLITSDVRNMCSVYIAIPFCPSRCEYCSFVSFTSQRLLSLIPEYLTALCSQIRSVFATIGRLGLEVATVYIGGGTPTTLNVSQLDTLLGVIGECWDVSRLQEFTLEAGRPDTIDSEKLAVAVRRGITRISVNTQTLNDAVLAAVGRRHTAEDFYRAYQTARDSGIQDINVDLIAGLPGEGKDSFVNSLDQVLALAPENITVHTFYVKRGASITKTDREIYRVRDMETTAAVETSVNRIQDAGYAPYYLYRQKNTTGNLENTGYALPGHPCLYNIYMMEEIHSIFGAGASAMTKLVSQNRDKKNILRICEKKYPYEYLAGEDAGGKAEWLYQSASDFYRNFREK
ncbi:oxygen-independent coproporphyrinogen-III oxidase-like protein HemZ [Clostridiales bacterium]|nr:oxygen-independent coproporphyrinogen-III oxidase-like protein HemZ [Clostridiales bacterium]